ncbi:aspartate kinase [Pseudidiomarina atlantica]|uniref:Bifunctional aspartokinase/homoserine dehydrogenase n=1 Tax=Pseudidiomarina atlantica TaxID=1517416 RepID=A0A094IQT4_9GAMM|nr:bifunctional aspartate kinase/homoserine dehydrogenase I [Pseudidiomarina atlantica]KFZ28214.1 aspartate kinase [Pseudidiomarina atlantica]
MQVLKFGGSSLGSRRKMDAVAAQLLRRAKGKQLMVVLSAPQGMTNLLETMLQQAQLGTLERSQLQEWRSRCLALIANESSAAMPRDSENDNNTKINSIKLSKSTQTQLESFIAQQTQLLEQQLQGIALLGECSNKIKAKLMSMGELISVQIMQALLNAEHANDATSAANATHTTSAGNATSAEILPAHQCLKASGDYLNAQVDIPASAKSLQRWLTEAESEAATAPQAAKTTITLVPGYQAAHEDDGLCVLGRNGSDYSAAVLAAALKAECCEIWTDVDGVYTADPRTIKSAQLIKHLSYEEAMELSHFGARILHPKTIAPLAQHNVPCLIKNSQRPQQQGTLIDAQGDPSLPIKGLSNLSQMALVTVSGPGLKGVAGISARVFSCLAQRNISINLITQSSSEFSISFCVEQHALTPTKKAISNEFDLELKANLIKPIDIQKNMAIISLIGDGMRHQVGLAARFFASLAQAHVNVCAMAQDSSERTVSAVISEQQAQDALKVCHENFFTHMPSIDVFVVGCGTVGKQLLEQIHRQQSFLHKRNVKLKVYGIANSQKLLTNAHGIDLSQWQQDLSKAKQSFSSDALKAFVKRHHLVNPVLVDCTSSNAIAGSYLDYLTSGFHVVTPNKKANTMAQSYYQKLKDTARNQHRRYLYETTVGAGLPIIDAVQGLQNAGDKLTEFGGILSGSLSYLFGLLEENQPFSKAIQQAREKGYTEPDPRDDLSGLDVARKLLIMAREIGLQLELDDIDIEPLLPASFQADDASRAESIDDFMARLPELDQHYQQRQQQAAKNGKVLRYVAQIKHNQCQVKIAELAPDHPLASIKNGENALVIQSDYYQPIPFVLRGYGAGATVTAAGIFSDIMRTLAWQQQGAA